MSFWFSARRATAYTRTANSNEKGQASRVTPGLSQRLRKTQQASQARRTDGQAKRLLTGEIADRFPFPLAAQARTIHDRLCHSFHSSDCSDISKTPGSPGGSRDSRIFFAFSVPAPRPPLGSGFASFASPAERRDGRDLRPSPITTTRPGPFLFPLSYRRKKSWMRSGCPAGPN